MIMNNMKHLLYTVAILLMAASCSNEEMEQVTESGKAKMQFRLSTSECPVQIVTRATPVPNEDNFVICITNKETGEEIEKDTLHILEANSPLYLPAGTEGVTYTVKAYSNEPTSGKAERNKPCFYAEKDTLVLPDETVTVKLECSLQQFQVSFVPSAAFMSAFRDDKMVDAQGGNKFKLTVSDANERSVEYNYTNLDESAYFDGDKTSPYIKIHVEGTTIKGFPVDYTETIEPNSEVNDNNLFEAKEHIIINLEVAESQSLNIKATQIEL